MDPQQRLVMEATWEALEDAGIPPQSLARSNTACFIGVNGDDYGKMVLEDLPGVEAWMGIGTAYCGVPNRVSYFLDLRGPSAAVDAACASSMIALHHGRQSILAGETNLAIVGGVNTLCHPGLTRVLDRARAISKDGQCRSFDNEACGYGRGEGASIIVLKRMSEALRNNDKILATLKSTASGQDGHTNGIMAPNGEAQEAVARTALGDIDPLSIQYVEAHATSTFVGDPIEIRAMSKIYGSNRTDDAPCIIGSIKPNIGHLEAGAGGMGFIKAVMAMKSGVIPPQANLKSLNTKIDWTKAGLKVPFEATDWPKVQGPRRAAICSYGYGGTVTHAIIEEAPAVDSSKTNGAKGQQEDGPNAFLLTSPQEKRIPTAARALSDFLKGDGAKDPLSTIACTLATRRGHHDYRAAFIAESHEEALEEIKNIADDSKNSNSIVSGRVLGKDAKNGAVWMLSGHGAQWPAMGEDLLAKEPVFAGVIDDLEPIISAELGFSARQALSKQDFESTDKIQVLTYAMQVGIATLLRSKGAQPSAVIGHSLGEIAASVVAGALTPSEGCIVVCKRAFLYRQVMGKGAMIAVTIPFEEVKKEIKKAGRRDIGAAIDSSPTSCVVSGSIDAINEFTKIWEERGIKVSRVKTDVAFHSPTLNPLAAPLSKALMKALSPKPPKVPLYSVSSESPRDQDPRDPTYWVRSMVNPVQLTSAVRAAAEDGYRIFLEVSTHPVITHSVNETLMDMDLEDVAVLPTLLREKPTRRNILRSITALWCNGIAIDWKEQFAGIDWSKNLPRTVWNRQPFWREVGIGSSNASLQHDVDTHTLLGQKIPVMGEKTTIFNTTLDDNTKPFPLNHPLAGTEIIPAAVLFNTFMHATSSRSLEDINLLVPVAISAPRNIQVIVQGAGVRLMSRLISADDDKKSENTSWLTHTTAKVPSELSNIKPLEEFNLDIPNLMTRIGTEMSPTFAIDYLNSIGATEMGFPWTVTHQLGNDKEMLSFCDSNPNVEDGKELPWSPTSWAPMFDAVTSIGSVMFHQNPKLRMPAHVDSVTVDKGATPPKKAYIYVSNPNEADLSVDITVTDGSGKALVRWSRMRVSEIDGPGLEEAGANKKMDGLVHQLAWRPAKLSEDTLPLDQVMFVATDNSPLLKGYSQQLAKRKVRTETVKSAQELIKTSVDLNADGSIIMYLPGEVAHLKDVGAASNEFCKELLSIIKHVVSNGIKSRVFVVTDSAHTGMTPTSLAHAPLVGLSRIIQAEQPDFWGALVDVDSFDFPSQAVKYISGAAVIKVDDTIARVARLRPMPKEKLYPSKQQSKLNPKSEGTYVISGGLGALGLEVASFLVERGARRIVLLSRRALPPRKTWSSPDSKMKDTIQKIQMLEHDGASVHCIPVDLSAPDAHTTLQDKLDALNLPEVLGVVHAAGIEESQLILETTPGAFNRVLAPKVSGSIALHQAFPPRTVDFFVLFSSFGQLCGFPGQASYAAGNAFLDAMAEHRHGQGDNSIAMQWTSWKNLGMSASAPEAAEFMEAEMENKGISSISRDEGFRAWDHIAKYDMSHGVVVRCLPIEADDPVPMDIIEDVVVRRAPTAPTAGGGEGEAPSSGGGASEAAPASGPERVTYMANKVAGCVASVLQVSSPEDVDQKAALADMGMDSVMMVALRRQLQGAMKVKVPPTLIWGHPTVGHLAKWFSNEVK